jgi:hypothetical protein
VNNCHIGAGGRWLLTTSTSLYEPYIKSEWVMMESFMVNENKGFSWDSEIVRFISHSKLVNYSSQSLLTSSRLCPLFVIVIGGAWRMIWEGQSTWKFWHVGCVVCTLKIHVYKIMDVQYFHSKLSSDLYEWCTKFIFGNWLSVTIRKNLYIGGTFGPKWCLP